ncbi:hypothetical protein BV20DRAFT_969486, partial [Pilatotrama ljubarskyi]
AKQSSDLLLDNAKRPPVFHYSDPAPLPGQERARIMNRTGTKVDSIGAGFVTGINTNNEVMNLVLASGPIEDGKEIYVDHMPVAKLWVNLDYNESQLLGANVNNVAAIWEQNLLELSGSEATVEITRDAKGRLTTKGGGASQISKIWSGASPLPYPTVRIPSHFACCAEQMLTGTMSRSSPVLAVAGMKAIVNLLADSAGSFAAFTSTFKESDNEAILQFTLAPWVSPSRASVAVLQAIDANTDDTGRMFLRTHTAAQLLYLGGNHEMWLDINPASDAWGPFISILPMP